MREFMDKLSRSIRGARKMAKLTQDELANLVGLSKSSISAYEVGTRVPTVETVALIATACGVGISEIVPRASLNVTVVPSGQTNIYDYIEE